VIADHSQDLESPKQNFGKLPTTSGQILVSPVGLYEYFISIMELLFLTRGTRQLGIGRAGLVRPSSEEWIERTYVRAGEPSHHVFACLTQSTSGSS
jgi:hypothetical protein